MTHSPVENANPLSHSIIGTLPTDITPILFTLGLLYPAAAMIGYIVREKELRLKELMKIMSVTESDIGWAWFMTFFLFHLMSATLSAFFSTILFENSSFLLLWIFWQLSLIAINVFCMTLSTITSKNTRAVLIGVLVILGGALLTILVDYNTASAGIIGLISLHPISAFTYGLRSIGRLEDLGLGIVSDTLEFAENSGDQSLRKTLGWLGIDALVWGFFSCYLNRVIPQDYGQSLPPWYMFVPSFWFPSIRPVNHSHILEEQSEKTAAVIESVGTGLKMQDELGQNIEIKSLHKVYGEKIALDYVSLSIYSGQITALLGHNGRYFEIQTHMNLHIRMPA